MKHMKHMIRVCLGIALTALVCCGCSDDGDSETAADVPPGLVGTWTWVRSVWRTGGAVGTEWTITEAQMQGFGLQHDIVIDARRNGSVTIDLALTDTGFGDINQTLSGTWTGTDTNVTLTLNARSVTIPYGISDDVLVFTVTLQQISDIAGFGPPVFGPAVSDTTEIRATFNRQSS